MSEGTKTALIAALTAVVVGIPGNYVVQRLLVTGQSRDTARGIARVLREDLRVRYSRIKSLREISEQIRDSIRGSSHVADAAGGGNLYPRGAFASLPRRVRLSLSGEEHSVQDRKLLAQQLRGADWDNVAGALRALEDMPRDLLSFFRDVRDIKAKWHWTPRKAALYEAGNVVRVMRLFERSLSAAVAGLAEVAAD